MYGDEAATAEELKNMLKHDYFLRPDVNLKVSGLLFTSLPRMLDDMIFFRGPELSVLPDSGLPPPS